jgi:hypothetical protein
MQVNLFYELFGELGIFSKQQKVHPCQVEEKWIYLLISSNIFQIIFISLWVVLRSYNSRGKIITFKN